MSISDLKKALFKLDVDTTDCTEKTDFVRKLREVQRENLAIRLHERSMQAMQSSESDDGSSADESEEKLQMTITIDGKSHEISVPSSCSVATLKKKLRKDRLTTLAVPAQKLIGRSKVLEDTHKLSDIISSNKSSKFMLLRDHSYVPSEVNLRLCMPNLKTPQLETFAPPTTTVRRFKQMLSDCHGFPAHTFYSLFLNGVHLQDDKQLKMYCLSYATDAGKQGGRGTATATGKSSKPCFDLQVVPTLQVKLVSQTQLVKAQQQTGNTAAPPTTPPTLQPVQGGLSGARRPSASELAGFFAGAAAPSPSPAPSSVTTPTARPGVVTNPLAAAEVNQVGGIPVADVDVVSAARSSQPQPQLVPTTFRTGFSRPASAGLGAGCQQQPLTARQLSRMDHVTVRTVMEVEWPGHPAMLQPELPRSGGRGAAAEDALAMIHHELKMCGPQPQHGAGGVGRATSGRSSGGHARWAKELQSMMQMCMLSGSRQFVMAVPPELAHAWVRQLSEKGSRRRRRSGSSSSSTSKDDMMADGSPAKRRTCSSSSGSSGGLFSRGFLSGAKTKQERRQRRKEREEAVAKVACGSALASAAAAAAAAAEAAVAAAAKAEKAGTKKKPKKKKKFKSLMADLMASPSGKDDESKQKMGTCKEEEERLRRANPKVEFSKLERI
jgi:hypothetical protein